MSELRNLTQSLRSEMILRSNMMNGERRGLHTISLNDSVYFILPSLAIILAMFFSQVG